MNARMSSGGIVEMKRSSSDYSPSTSRRTKSGSQIESHPGKSKSNRGSRRKRDVVDTAYYDLLGVSSGASRGEIRRRLKFILPRVDSNMKAHVSKVGAVLLNKELRYIYDYFGVNGVETFNWVRYETWSANDTVGTWLMLIGGWCFFVFLIDPHLVIPLEWVLCGVVSVCTGLATFVRGVIGHVLRTNYKTQSDMIAFFLTVLVIASLDSAVYFVVPNRMLPSIANISFFSSFLLSLNASFEKFHLIRTSCVFLGLSYLEQVARPDVSTIPILAMPLAAHTALFGVSYTVFQVIRLVTSPSQRGRGFAQRIGRMSLRTFDWLRSQRYGYEIMVLWVPISALSTLLQFPVEYVATPLVALPILAHGLLGSFRGNVVRIMIVCALVPLFSHIFLPCAWHAAYSSLLLYFTTLYIAGDRHAALDEMRNENTNSFSMVSSSSERHDHPEDTSDDANDEDVVPPRASALHSLRLMNALNALALAFIMLLLDFSFRISQPQPRWPATATLSAFSTLVLFVSHVYEK